MSRIRMYAATAVAFSLVVVSVVLTSGVTAEEAGTQSGEPRGESSHAVDADPPETLVIQTNDWSSQLVFSHVVGLLLEKRGQPVEFQSTDTVLQFDSLAAGDAHFQVEVWHNRMAEQLETALDVGVIDAGHHRFRFRDGWWVSDATMAACPGADTWDGLSACVRERAGTPADSGDVPLERQGVFRGPPESFGRNYAELVALLDMPFSLEAVPDLGALQEQWAAFDAEDDLPSKDVLEAVYSWSPNTLNGPIQGQFVAFPKPELACFIDPDWGPNPDATGDCGDPPHFPVSKVAWAGVLDAFPGVWPLLQSVEFDTTDYRQVVDWMSEPQAHPEAVARRWIDANADRVETWMHQTL